MNEQMKGWMDEWIDGWASYFSLLSYFFTERPLRWGTSSCSYFFSEQHWAATYLGYFCSELPPNYLFSTFCNPIFLFAQLCDNAFSNLLGAPQHALLRGGVPMRLSQPVAHPHSRSVTPNRPSFAQQMTMGTALSFLLLFMWNRALDTVSCTFCRPHLPKVPRALATVLCSLCRLQLETETLLRRPQEPHYPKEHRVSRPRAFNYLMMGGFFHDDVIFPCAW